MTGQKLSIAALALFRKQNNLCHLVGRYPSQGILPESLWPERAYCESAPTNRKGPFGRHQGQVSGWLRLRVT